MGTEIAISLTFRRPESQAVYRQVAKIDQPPDWHTPDALNHSVISMNEFVRLPNGVLTLKYVHAVANGEVGVLESARAATTAADEDSPRP